MRINRIQGLDFGRDFTACDVKHIEYLTSHLIDGAQESHDLETFVPIHFETAGKVVPKNKLAALKKRAVECGHWEQRADRKYRAGSYSMSYRLAAKWRRMPIYRTAAHAHIAEKLNAWKSEREQCIGEPVLTWLLTQLRRLRANVDLGRQLIRAAKHDYEDLLLMPLLEVNDGEHYRSVCAQGRVHTNFTRASRIVRPAFSLNGRPLAGVDISNSQLLFAVFLFQNPDLYADFDFSQEFHLYLPNQLQPTNPIPHMSHLFDWSDLAQSGKWYEHVASLLGWERERVKKAVLPLLMGPNHYRSPVKTVCEKEFSYEMGVLHDFKVRDFAYLPCLLQYIESSFVIGTVCRRMMELGIPVISLHDCLFTTPDHLPRLRQVIHEEAAGLGLRITLKDDPNRPITASPLLSV
jgi:hypothetical protein